MNGTDTTAMGDGPTERKEWEDAVFDCLKRMYKEKDVASIHKQSYDSFIHYRLQKIIEEEPCVEVCPSREEKIRVEFGQVFVDRPCIIDEERTMRYIMPNEARLRDLTYSSAVSVNLHLCHSQIDPSTGEEVSREEKDHFKILLARIPVMIGSSKCNLFGKTKEEWMQAGECEADTSGGYFIIRGKERVLVAQERVNYNMVHVFEPKVVSKYSNIAEIRSISEETGHSVLIQMKLQQEDYQVVLQVPYFNQEIPFGVLLRVFDLPLVFFEQMLSSQMTKEEQEHDDVHSILRGIRKCFYMNETVEDAVQYLSPFVSYSMVKERRMMYIKQIVSNELFPHLGILSTSHEKVAFLSHMLSVLLKTQTNVQKHSDRDYLGNKRLETSGILLSELFRTLYKRCLRMVECQLMRKQDILMILSRSNNITNGIKHCFATGNWGVPKSNYIRTGVSQVLSRMTYSATISHLQRVLIPIGKEGKNTKVRQLHPSQVGFFDAHETPEGHCLLAGSRVLLSCGMCPIENIVPGQEGVLTTFVDDNRSRSPLRTSEVVEVFQKENRKWFTFGPKGTERSQWYRLQCTGCHPLFAWHRGKSAPEYVMAEDIDPAQHRLAIVPLTWLQLVCGGSSRLRTLSRFLGSRTSFLASRSVEYCQRHRLSEDGTKVRWPLSTVSAFPSLLSNHPLGMAEPVMHPEYGAEYEISLERHGGYRPTMTEWKTLFFLPPWIAASRLYFAEYLSVQRWIHKSSEVVIPHHQKESVLGWMTEIVSLTFRYFDVGLVLEVVQSKDPEGGSDIRLRCCFDGEASERRFSFFATPSEWIGRRIQKMKQWERMEYFRYWMGMALGGNTEMMEPSFSSVRTTTTTLWDCEISAYAVFVPCERWVTFGSDAVNVYDMNIRSQTHNFIAEGFLVHNSAGIVKNLSMLTHVSGRFDGVLYRMIVQHTLDCTDFESPDLGSMLRTGYKVFLNGIWMGVVRNGPEYYRTMREWKRLRRIPLEVSIFIHEWKQEICFFSDEGRMLRPFFSAKNMPTVEILRTQGWTELIRNHHVVYLDIYEIENAYIALYPWEMTEHHDYCEIHPFTWMGLCTGLIPYAEHTQAPRLCYEASMAKQAIGIYSGTNDIRADTIVHVLQNPELPFVQTHAADWIPYHQRPCGNNLIVAIACYTGFNQEDSLIFNQASVDRGVFRSFSYRTVNVEEKKKNSICSEVITLPPVAIRQRSFHYDKLDERGIIRVGAYVGPNDVLVGKVIFRSIQTVGSLSKWEVPDCHEGSPVDASVPAKHGDEGVVDRVFLTTNDDGFRLVKIKIRQLRVLEQGDKLASRNAQKGVVGMILPQEDMPFSLSGIVPDVIMNPHAIPSRMTINQLLESVGAKVCAHQGSTRYSTAFSAYSQGVLEELCRALQSCGYQCHGNERLMNGITGEMMESLIFMGPTYYLRLKHLVSSKIHARDHGNVQCLTRQPSEGRSKDGGLRFGEMEKDCVHADSSISLSCGLSLPLSSFSRGNWNVITYQLSSSSTPSVPPKAFLDKDKKECVRLRLEDGREIICTPDHRVLTEEQGWTEVRNLIIGTSRIIVGTRFPRWDASSGADTIPSSFRKCPPLCFSVLPCSLVTEDSWELGRLCRLLGVLSCRGFLTNEAGTDLVSLRWVCSPSSSSLDPRHSAVEAVVADLPQWIQGEVIIQEPFLLGFSATASRVLVEFSSVGGSTTEQEDDVSSLLYPWIFEATCPVWICREFIASQLGGIVQWIHVLSTSVLSTVVPTEPIIEWVCQKPVESCILRVLQERFEVVLDRVFPPTTTLKDEKGSPVRYRMTRKSFVDFHKHVGLRFNVFLSAHCEHVVSYVSHPRWKGSLREYIQTTMIFPSHSPPLLSSGTQETWIPPLTFYLTVVHREPMGLQPVCDLEVPLGHSFFANGILVHNCMISHGTSRFLRERLYDMSDPFEAPICTVCECISNTWERCHECQSTDVQRIELPYACKLLFQELNAMGIKMTFAVSR